VNFLKRGSELSATSNELGKRFVFLHEAVRSSIANCKLEDATTSERASNNTKQGGRGISVGHGVMGTGTGKTARKIAGSPGMM
jgi:hypothetical protein